jgi:hypothetical protein
MTRQKHLYKLRPDYRVCYQRLVDPQTWGLTESQTGQCRVGQLESLRAHGVSQI